MKREFTATVYLIEECKVLLLFHPKLKKWLPPGGHVEEGETPPEAARREVYEETGLELEFITDENIVISRWNAKSFERPYMCLIEEIPPHKDQPAHQHLDFIYLARPTRGVLNSPDPIKWWSWEEVEALTGDVDIFEETKEAIASILKKEVAIGK
ncbi:MAG: NUDIX domain-containing protein [Chlamydiia bacterium]|nr:NUDIX domain-containing protein [Chlamydiia bacterium]